MNSDKLFYNKKVIFILLYELKPQQIIQEGRYILLQKSTKRLSINFP